MPDFNYKAPPLNELNELNQGVIAEFRANEGRVGGPTNPGWYYNLTTAGEASVETGTSAFPVTVTELTGDERDRIYAEQVKAAPNFADYAKKAEGIRVIPVLRLTRR